MHPHELIRAARLLAAGRNSPGQPTDAELRRAVSTAYYALFHALAGCCANLLVGSAYANTGNPLHELWIQTYRGLNHSTARRRCAANFMGTFPTAIQNFGRQFVRMQNLRHESDYNPDASFTPNEVLKLIDDTEAVIDDFRNAPEEERRAFAFYIMYDFNVS